MKVRSFNYFVYNNLRKKGVKILFLTADWYPVNYLIVKADKKYFIVFREINLRSKIIIHDVRFGENIFVMVYDKFQSKYYLLS